MSEEELQRQRFITEVVEPYPIEEVTEFVCNLIEKIRADLIASRLESVK